MLAASFDLIHEGEPHGPSLVVLGLLCGAVFIAFLQRFLRDFEDVEFAALRGADARKQRFLGRGGQPPRLDLAAQGVD